MAGKAVRRGRTKKEPQRRGRAMVRKVLDVTLEQLAQVGFERLSVPEVASLAGVNKTSVYRRWPTKSDLVREALGVAMEEHTTPPPDTGNVRGDLLALARSVAEFVASPRGRGILRTLFAESAHPEVRFLATSMYREQDARIPRDVLVHAIQRGELPATVDVKLVLFTLAGALLHRVFVEQAQATPAFLEGVVDLVLFGATRAPPPAKVDNPR